MTSRRDIAQFIIKSRRDRQKFFGGWLFADPAWDILLELYAAHAERRSGVSAGQLSKIANVPLSTVERWLAALIEESLVEIGARNPASLQLTEKGWFAMDSYFESMSSGIP